MAYAIPPPSPMVCSGNLEQNWAFFKESWLDYRTAVSLGEKDETIQIATLRSIMGMECKKRLRSITLTDTESKSHDAIIKKLDEHFKPPRIFFLSSQQQGESVDQFFMRLKQLAEQCKFGAMEEEMIRDKLVIGCTDSAAKARIFRLKENDATLKTTLESLRISEATNLQLKSLDTKQHSSVFDTDAVNANSYKRQKPHGNQYNKQNSNQNATSSKQCDNCGLLHKPKQCPAFGQTCHSCGKRNHWKKKCRSKPWDNRSAKQAHEVRTNGDSDSDNPESYGSTLK